MRQFLVWRCQHDNIIHKKQRWNLLGTEPDPLWPVAAPRNSVHENIEQNRSQRTALSESYMHWEQIWLSAGNANQAPAKFAEGLQPDNHEALPTESHEGHGQRPPDLQNTCSLVGQTPMNPWAPCGGYRAGPVFHSQDKNTFFLLNPRFNYQLNSPFQYPGVDFEECDPLIIVEHPPVPLIKKGNHHPSLPFLATVLTDMPCFCW